MYHNSFHSFPSADIELTSCLSPPLVLFLNSAYSHSSFLLPSSLFIHIPLKRWQNKCECQITDASYAIHYAILRHFSNTIGSFSPHSPHFFPPSASTSMRMHCIKMRISPFLSLCGFCFSWRSIHSKENRNLNRNLKLKLNRMSTNLHFRFAYLHKVYTATLHTQRTMQILCH